jgi:DNA-binding transcriptional ArsR family regulator
LEIATRASILWNLLDGRAFTATELAITVETSAQNISMHLGKLLEADLICVEKQGRHKYYRFSNKEVAYAVEAMANLIPKSKVAVKKKSEEYPPIKYCRTCYDHLAGKIGVALADSLLEQKIIIEKSGVFEISI